MFGRKRKLDDFNAEIDAHLAAEVERLREQGLSYLPAVNPVGRHFGWGLGGGEIEIVGVVNDAKVAGPREATPPNVYLPMFQRNGDESYENQRVQAYSMYAQSMQVRVVGDPAAFVQPVRADFKRLAPNIPLIRVQPFDRLIGDSLT